AAGLHFRFRSVVSRWAEVYRVKSSERPTRVKEVVARFELLLQGGKFFNQLPKHLLAQGRELVLFGLKLAPCGRTFFSATCLTLRSPHTYTPVSTSCVIGVSPSPPAPAPGGSLRHGPYRPRLMACNSSETTP